MACIHWAGDGCTTCDGMPVVALAKSFPDDSAYVVCEGVQISVGPENDLGFREVYGLDDWGKADALVAAGVLVRRAWQGSGLDGHDDYFLIRRPVA